MDWEGRKAAVAAAIAELDPAMIAFQEMETFGGGHAGAENVQLNFVLDQFPDLDAAAVGDPELYPSTQPVLYRRDRFAALDQGYFFFSPTPDEIYSRPWHKRFPAFCSWVRFEDLRTRETFVIYNVHFDASSGRNRLKSARLVVDRIQNRAYPDDPVLVVGDFNSPSFFPTMRIFARSGFHRAATRGSTFHFNRGRSLIPGIDHLLGTDRIDFDGAEVLRETYQGVYPSDHYPIAAYVSIAPKGAK